MLGMEYLDMMFTAGFGGLFGVAIGTIAHRQNVKFNLRMMEEYWNADIRRLQSHIDVLEQKISTISGNKAVSNVPKHSHHKRFKSERHYNQEV